MLRCSLSYAKIMQMSAMKACFQIAECSLSYAKIKKNWKTNEMRTKIFERKFPVGQFTASN